MTTSTMKGDRRTVMFAAATLLCALGILAYLSISGSPTATDDTADDSLVGGEHTAELTGSTNGSSAAEAAENAAQRRVALNPDLLHDWSVHDSISGDVIQEAALRITFDAKGKRGIIAAWASGYSMRCFIVDNLETKRLELDPTGSVLFVASARSLNRSPQVDIVSFPLGGSPVGSGEPVAPTLEELANLYSVISGPTTDAAARAAMDTVIQGNVTPIRSLQIEGTLPVALTELPAGDYTYRVVGQSALVEPEMFRPFAEKLPDGRISSDPEVRSHKRDAMPFEVRPRHQTVVELFVVQEGVVRGIIPRTLSLDGAYANIHLRHEESNAGERRIDIEAALVGRMFEFEFTGVRPGRKSISATVRDGDTIVYLSCDSFELDPGEIHDVGTLVPESSRLAIQVRVNGSMALVGDQADAITTITIISRTRRQEFVNRSIEVKGVAGDVTFVGLPAGHYTILLDPARSRSTGPGSLVHDCWSIQSGRRS